MSMRICKTCYQYEDDHHAKFATSWDWCREHEKFIHDYDSCDRHRTFDEAISEGLILIGVKS